MLEQDSKKSQKKASKKGAPRSTGKRKAKINFYYEITYPLKKLRRIWNHTKSIPAVKAWADWYKCPSGMSANGLLVKLAKEKGFHA